jgi:hypothetical protein
MFSLHNCTLLRYHYLSLYVILSVYTLYVILSVYTPYVILSLHYTSSFYTVHDGWGNLVRARMRFLFLAGVCTRLAFRCGHVLLSVWVWLFLSSWALYTYTHTQVLQCATREEEPHPHRKQDMSTPKRQPYTDPSRKQELYTRTHKDPPATVHGVKRAHV